MRSVEDPEAVAESLGDVSEADEAGGSWETSLTRKQVVKRAGLTSFGLLLAASVPSVADAATQRLSKTGRKRFGPTGFKGATNYQFEATSAPGRALLRAKQLKSQGKAPDTLVVGLYSGAVGQYETPFPKGNSESINEMFTKYTGIRVKFDPVDPALVYQKALKIGATKDGRLNTIVFGLADMGDLAEAGIIADLSEYVQRLRPDWSDPKLGYTGGARTARLLNYYNGKPYGACGDGDWQIFRIRKDLIESPKEGKAFRARYGYELDYPRTWDDYRDIAQFFTRPDKRLLGATDLRSPGWGTDAFPLRFASLANPVKYYFDDDMNPQINGPAGLKVMKHLLETHAFNSPDALSWIWLQQFTNWGAGGSAMTWAFPNLLKVTSKTALDKVNIADKDTAILMPGWKVNGQLVAHDFLYFMAIQGVNRYSPSKYHEAAYCYLQYVTASQVYNLITANPSGYNDPNKVTSFDDPYVRSTYGAQTMDVQKIQTRGAVPQISGLPGANEYIQAMDINQQKMLSKQITPEQALDAIESSWNKTTKRIGREKVAKAWRAQKKLAWPTKPNHAAYATKAELKKLGYGAP